MEWKAIISRRPPGPTGKVGPLPVDTLSLPGAVVIYSPDPAYTMEGEKENSLDDAIVRALSEIERQFPGLEPILGGWDQDSSRWPKTCRYLKRKDWLVAMCMGPF